jgi:hypothetical protein
VTSIPEEPFTTFAARRATPRGQERHGAAARVVQAVGLAEPHRAGHGDVPPGGLPSAIARNSASVETIEAPRARSITTSP